MKAAYTEMLQKLSEEPMDDNMMEVLNTLGKDDRDSLTGFYDFRSFSNHLKTSAGDGVLAGFSIDFLEELNILSSWVMGDLAICGLAKALEENLEGTAITGRISGSTIIVYRPLTDKNSIMTWIKGAMDKVGDIKLPGIEIFPEEKLTLSVGFLVAGNLKAKPSDGLIQEIKKRIYHSRAAGGNTVSSISGKTDVSTEKITENFDFAVVDGSEDFKVNLTKISPSGAAFVSKKAYLVRDAVTLKILSSGQEIFKQKCEVVWRKPSENMDGFSTGLGFGELDEESRSALNKVIAGGAV